MPYTPVPGVVVPPQGQALGYGAALRAIPQITGAKFRQAAGGGAELLGDMLQAEALSKAAAQFAQRGRELEQRARPLNQSFWQGVTTDAGVSLGTMAPLAPYGALPLVGGISSLTAGESFSHAKAKGEATGVAARFGVIDGLIEGATELLPAKFAFKKGTPAFKRLVQIIATEVGGEEVAYFGQMLNSQLHGLSEKVTAREFVDGLKHTAAVAAVTAGAASGVGSAVDAVRPRPVVEDPVVEDPVVEAPEAEAPPVVQEIIERNDEAYARGVAKIGDPGVPLKVKLKESLQDANTKAYQYTLDHLKSVELAEMEMKGFLSEDADSPTTLLRNLAGVRGVGQSVIEDATPGIAENGDIVPTGDGLMKALLPAKGNMADFAFYAVGKRAQELESQARKSGFDTDSIDQFIRLGQVNPALEEAHANYRAFNGRLLDFVQQSGRINAQQRAALDEMGKNYVSFQRVMDAADGRVGNEARAKPLKNYKGSGKNVINTWDAMTGNTLALVEMAVENRAKKSFFDMLDAPGGEQFAVKVSPPPKASDPGRARVIESLEKEGVKGLPKVVSDTATSLFHKKPSFEGGTEVFWRDGEMETWKFTPEAYLLQNSFEAVGPQVTDAFVRGLGTLKHVYSAGITSFPAFQAANLMRDSGQRYVQTKYNANPLRFAASTINGLKETWTKSPVYYEYLRNGGGFVSVRQNELGDERASLRDWHSSRGFAPRQILNTTGKLWDSYSEALTAVELANRVSEYKAVREAGGSRTKGTYRGRDISTDFGRHGSHKYARLASTLYPFLNARVQSLDRMRRQVGKGENRAERVRRFALRGTLGLTAPALALYLLNREDERYRDLPQDMKDQNLTFYFSDDQDTPIFVPLPFEVGQLFATLPIRLLEDAIEDESRLGPAMERMFTDTFAMDPRPLAIRPMLELMNNERYGDVPIVPPRALEARASERNTPYTSETAKRIGSAASWAAAAVGSSKDVSGAEVEHLIKGYFSGWGQMALAAADALLPHGGSGERPSTSLKEKTGFRRFSPDAPMRRTQAQQDYYDIADEVRELAATLAAMKKRGADPREELTDPKDQVLYAMAKQHMGHGGGKRASPYGTRNIPRMLGRVTTQIQLVREGKTVTESGKKLTGEQKQNEIKRLTAARNAIYKEASAAGFNRKALAKRVAQQLANQGN